MPVLLLANEDGTGHILRELRDDEVTIHDLRPEGAQILLNVYGLKVGGPVDHDTLQKLVGLQLAKIRATEAPKLAEAKVDVPEVEQPEPVVAAPSVLTPIPTPIKTSQARLKVRTPTPPVKPTPPASVRPQPAIRPGVATGRGPLSRVARDAEKPAEVAPRPTTPRNVPVVETRSTTLRQQRRTRAREVALQVLYQIEQNPGIPQWEINRFFQRRLGDVRLVEFAKELVSGVKGEQEKIDAMITEVAENWRLDRMAAIDRNILRLGAFEMLFDESIPAKVAINEALELAKRYSTAQSSRFVNGILDRLLSLENQKQTEVSATSESETEIATEAKTDDTSASES
jgi:N utilization substance protein B